MDSMSIIKVIEHYQRSIEKCGGNDDRMIHCINKLYTLPVTVSHLQETGIGRTVNSLRKFEGRVGHAARALVAKWKAMVAAEESSGSEQEERSEEVECELTNSTEIEENNKNYVDESYSGNHYEISKSHKYEKVKQEERTKETSKQKHNRHSESRKRKNDEEIVIDHKKRKEEKSHKEKKENTYKCDLKTKADIKIDSSKSKKSLEQISKYDKNSDSAENSHKRTEDKSDKESRNKNSSGNSEDKNSFSIKNSKKHHHKSSKNVNSEENKKSRDKIRYENNDQNKSYSSSKENNELNRKSVSDKKKGEQKLKKSKKHHSSCDEDEENKKVSSSKQNMSSYSKKEADNSLSNKSSKQNKKKLDKAAEYCDGEEGINSFSGASFAEALGMMANEHLSPARKKASSSCTYSVSPSKSSLKSNKTVISDMKSSKSADLLSPDVKLPAIPTELDIDVNLPIISPNYKPLPNTINQLSSIYRGVSQEEALSAVMSHKNLRTKVYSGNKTGWAAVPSLFDLCIRILQENIDALEYTGGVPFSILQPVLERATPDQLSTLEYYNPNLLEDTDMLWEQHCKREFRGKIRQELETWREAYTRFSFEREEKLKELTANIKQSTIDKLTPLRQTKLAYLDSVVKPPRAVAKKQAKWGTASNVKPITTPASRIAGLNSANSTSGSNIFVPNPVKAASTSTSSKPRKAPLMAKTLSLLKNTSRYRR